MELNTDASIDIDRFERDGFLCVPGAVPQHLCERLVTVLERELLVPLREPVRWGQFGGPMGDFLPIWGHQAQWDIRQHPNVHRVFAELWGTQALWVTLDSCRFTPPWRPGFAEPHDIHWDHDPWDATSSSIQGVVALTDTAADQGGFCCVPSLLHDRDAWPKQPHIDAEGTEWLADVGTRDVVHVPARTGDLIVWNSRLAHGNSKNRANRPRLAFYVSMDPVRDRAFSAASIESWRTGRCVPWWRDRPGYDRVEPWPPAELTPLGRCLIGLDRWPSAEAEMAVPHGWGADAAACF
jgi:Phytanoyl-CoA dioxygenase (PhyH)